MKTKQTAIIILRCIAIYMLVQAGIGLISQLLFIARMNSMPGSSPDSLLWLSGLAPLLFQAAGSLLLWLRADALADMVVRYAPLQLLERYQELEDKLKN